MQQPAFDLYAGMFTVGEIAEITGVKRAIVDVWLARGVVTATRREKPTGRKPRPRVRASARRGRPLFACRDAFKVALAGMLIERLSLSSTDAKQIEAAGLGKLLDAAAGGEWMYAVARSIGRPKPLIVYAYATRQDGKWLLDAHVGSAGATPCFGWSSPHVFLPMSALFVDVYENCKSILSTSQQAGEPG